MLLNKVSFPFSPVQLKAPNTIIMTGREFGELKVLSIYGFSPTRNLYWLCHCKCGKFSVTPGSILRNGTSQTCGHSRTTKPNNLRHGHARGNGSHEYKAFLNAKERCQRPANISYKHYGGRGIEFRFDSFEEFFKEIGTAPSPQYWLDRIRTNGHYERGNIQWATPQTQQRNRRNNHMVTFHNQTKTLAEWGDTALGGYHLLRLRIRRGWCMSCAYEQPKRGTCPHRNAT